MSDIFISYMSTDRPVAEKLANCLLKLGYSVWWDLELYAGEKYADVIEYELGQAKLAIVLWSENAKKSIWVRDEATKALDSHKLVPIRIDKLQIPMPFGSVHTIDFTTWNGGEHDKSFNQLVKAINKILGKPPGDQVVKLGMLEVIFNELLLLARRYWIMISFVVVLVVAAMLVRALYPPIIVSDFYSHPGGSFERKGEDWVEYPEYALGQNFKFESSGYDMSYLYLVDKSRHKPGDPTRVFYMRLPLRGGMAQWSYPNPYIWQDLYMVTPKSLR